MFLMRTGCVTSHKTKPNNIMPKTAQVVALLHPHLAAAFLSGHSDNANGHSGTSFHGLHSGHLRLCVMTFGLMCASRRSHHEFRRLLSSSMLYNRAEEEMFRNAFIFAAEGFHELKCLVAFVGPENGAGERALRERSSEKCAAASPPSSSAGWLAAENSGDKF